MPSLGESSYCESCGTVYRTSDGHNCSTSAFTSPEVAREAALIFTALGTTGAEILAGKHPDDPAYAMFAELAEGVDELLAGGMTPDRARRLIPKYSPAGVPLPRDGDGWQTHRSCSSCAPCAGNCGCGCHSPVSRAPVNQAAAA
jgi:hypothetical protein